MWFILGGISLLLKKKSTLMFLYIYVDFPPNFRIHIDIALHFINHIKLIFIFIFVKIIPPYFQLFYTAT